MTSLNEYLGVQLNNPEFAKIYDEVQPEIDAIRNGKGHLDDKWYQLKETIIELRDNAGPSDRQEVCKFLVNLMEILEKENNS